jgi:hypothetical protein
LLGNTQTNTHTYLLTEKKTKTNKPTKNRDKILLSRSLGSYHQHSLCQHQRSPAMSAYTENIFPCLTHQTRY